MGGLATAADSVFGSSWSIQHSRQKGLANICRQLIRKKRVVKKKLHKLQGTDRTADAALIANLERKVKRLEKSVRNTMRLLRRQENKAARHTSDWARINQRASMGPCNKLSRRIPALVYAAKVGMNTNMPTDQAMRRPPRVPERLCSSREECDATWKRRFGYAARQVTAPTVEGSFDVETGNPSTRSVVLKERIDNSDGDAIGMKELGYILSRLPNRRGEGRDGIKYELLKRLDPANRRILHLFFQRMLITGSRWPEMARAIIVQPVYKGKGDPLNSQHYRPVALQSSVL